MGFNDIAVWASKVQERVDGKGYPYGLSSEKISFECKKRKKVDF